MSIINNTKLHIGIGVMIAVFVVVSVMQGNANEESYLASAYTSHNQEQDIHLQTKQSKVAPGETVRIQVAVEGAQDIVGVDHYFYYDPEVITIMNPNNSTQPCVAEELCVTDIIKGDMFMEATNPTDTTGGSMHLSISKTGFQPQNLLGYTNKLEPGLNTIYEFIIQINPQAPPQTTYVIVGNGEHTMRSSVNLDNNAERISTPPYQGLQIDIVENKQAQAIRKDSTIYSNNHN